MTAPVLAGVRARAMALAATGCTAIVSLVVVLAARWGPDWPAQEFRAWIAVHDGLSAWTARWYGGSALPGYSILYPPLAKVVGAGGVGLAAVVLASWAAAGLAPHGRVRSILYHAAVAVNLVEMLLIGQVPFLLGAAFGVTAFRAVVRRRHWSLVLALAILSSLATPLAGAFLLLVIPACAVAFGTRRALPLAGSLAGPAITFAVGGASGPFPFTWQLLASSAAFAVLLVMVSPRENRGLRVFAVSYLLVAIALFVIPDPIGGNLARLARMLALPMACHLLVVDRAWLRVRAVAVAALAFVWPTLALAGSIANGATDPSQSEQFYTGVISYLDHHNVGAGRVEIPFTREHWESFWVAKHVLLARGWERQTDYRYNQVLYQPLAPDVYRRWLSDNAVDFVALPDVPIDTGGTAEAELLKNPPPYLQPVWHDSHWQVWRVRHAASLVTGAATLADFDSSSLTLDFRRAGAAEVKVHYNPLWHLSSGHACITATSSGWLEVRAEQPGRIGLSAGLNAHLLAPPPTC